jgi:hypothetical protein
MAIEPDEKPRYHNIIYKKFAKFAASTSAGALGSDSNGVLIHTFTKQGFVASIKISSSDAGNNGIFLYVKDGSDIMPEGSVSVPLNSGNTAAVANVDGLANSGISSRGDWIEQNGKRVIPCEGGQDFKASLISATGASEEIYVTCVIYEQE